MIWIESQDLNSEFSNSKSLRLLKKIILIEKDIFFIVKVLVREHAAVRRLALDFINKDECLILNYIAYET